MRRAVARGTGLTHQLLAFTRRQAINPESIDLAAQLRSMREMLEHSLRGGARVEMTPGAELWPVEVDVGEFEWAMLNLFANARDAMPDGGAITVDARNMTELAEGLPTDFVQLSVADTGSGMPPSVLERVFEPFFTTKEVGKGSGLGLPQVYGFAQQSGGCLRIDSRVQVGTTVT
ncbi:MAG: hybrid sensor histidine kinase/response regulator, partial [Comamonadaceae bacterium]